MNLHQPISALSAQAVDFAGAFERSPSALLLIDVRPTRLIVAAASAGLPAALGVSGLDLTGRDIDQLFLTEAHLMLGGAIRRAAASGESARLTLELQRGGHGWRHDVVITPVDAGPPCDSVLLTVEPRPPRAVRTSDVLLNQVEALGEGMIVVFDVVRNRARYMSAELADLLGHDMSGPFDTTIARRMAHSEDFDALSAYVDALGPMGAPGVSSVTLRVRRPGGGWRWLELRGRALTLKTSGAPRTVLLVAVDVTERRAMARALDRAARAVVRAGEQERRKVARDLHDSTAQHLVAIDLALTSLEHRLEQAGDIREIMRDMHESIALAHREIRTYSYLLHPPQLQRLGLEATLERFVEGFARRANLAIEVLVTGAPASLTNEVALTLFRIAQESLMNIHRHAGATHAVVRLIRAPEAVVLEVEDDGVGLPETAESGSERQDGVGIPGMRARMAQIGGLLDLIPLARGLCVRATAPI